jgi:hypothetical protein
MSSITIVINVCMELPVPTTPFTAPFANRERYHNHERMLLVMAWK